MFANAHAFSGFSVNDIAAAKRFYGETLGLDARENAMGALDLHIAGGVVVFVYAKPDHVPATFTVLNFPVDNIDETVDALNAAGVVTKIYDGGFTDERGIAHGKAINRGPDIVWFTDPAGNVLSALSN